MEVWEVFVDKGNLSKYLEENTETQVQDAYDFYDRKVVENFIKEVAKTRTISCLVCASLHGVEPHAKGQSSSSTTRKSAS